MWQGVAAEQARVVHDALLAGLGRWVSGIEAAVAVFNTAADDLAELVDVLRRCDTMAAEHGYMITDDGTVAAAGEDSRTDTPRGRRRMRRPSCSYAPVWPRRCNGPRTSTPGCAADCTNSSPPCPARPTCHSRRPWTADGWSTLVGLPGGPLDRNPPRW